MIHAFRCPVIQWDRLKHTLAHQRIQLWVMVSKKWCKKPESNKFLPFLDNLRGLLSHQGSQQYPPMGNFGPTAMTSMDGRGMTSQQQAAAMQQMRTSYMNSQAGHYSGAGGSNSGNLPNGQMPTNAAAMQRYQQMQTSRQQMMNQMRNSPQNMMNATNMKNTSMRFPPGTNPAAIAAANAQANFNHSTTAQQIVAQLQQVAAAGGAKWHTPQQKQASSHHNNNLSAMMGMSMSPPANNFINDSFKIPLRSPDTLRNNHQGGQSTSSSANGQNQTSFPIPLPNVSSTAPKTPSPSQKEKEIDSIDMVCNESVVDLLATIAKLDSNGVQVVPEGRNKATSPQVHSSTSDSMDPNSISLNDKSLNQSKDDPNEDWCAVCMGKSASCIFWFFITFFVF